VLLRATVDLLWFGGIGTFVKAAEETHGEVGDRANDPVRVDGAALRCKVVGEGANLGVTQLGRIEFAKAGGRITTDFIDNSAGVDCSDHEVNIKILLDAIVADGDLTTKQRNHLLVDMTDEVAALVLRDNYLQTQALSLIEAEGFAGLDGQTRLMRLLERQGRLNRVVEFLPDDEALTERAARRQGLTRPELAVLFSYSKIWLNDELLASDLPDDRHVADDVARYFPTAIRQRFGAQIAEHRLRRELIATTVTNSLINRMGGSFVADMREKTGMTIADIARCYIISRDVFGIRDLWSGIEDLDGLVPTATQIDLHRETQWLLERGTLWFLRNGGIPPDIAANIAALEQPVRALAGQLDRMLPTDVQRLVDARRQRWVADGVPDALAAAVARLIVLPSACDIVRIAAERNVPTEAVAGVYFLIGGRLGFGWLRGQAEGLPASGHWQRLAVAAVIEELYAHQRDVTQKVLAAGDTTAEGGFEAWSASRKPAIDRSRALLTELEAAKELDISMLAVASRQLRALAES
jgi:glutamate dehydrogenase